MARNIGSVHTGRWDVGLFCVRPQLRIRSINTTRHREDHTSGLYKVGNNCRLFSSKNIAKFQARVSSKNASDHVGGVHENGPIRSSLLQIFQERQKQTKTLSSCNGIRGEVKAVETAKMDLSNVKVDAPKIKNRTTKAIKLAEESVDTLKSEKPLSQGVKKRQASSKNGEKTPKAKSTTEKSQRVSRKKVQTLPADGISSGEVETEGKKTVRRRKTKSTGDSVSTVSKEASSGGGLKMGKREIRPLYPPSGKSVVIVESATKAKIIQNYLGNMFEVLPSYGHVRDLAGRSGSVRPDDDFSMVWEVPSSAWTHLKSIKVALGG